MMKNKASLTKILAIPGTIFTWLPILAPIFFSLIRFFQSGRVRLDYLMPAELFPVALIGGGLLIWAAFRAHRRRGLMYWSVIAQVLLLVGSQALAVVTGLASGATEPVGIAWALVVTLLALFILAILVTAIGGILLIRDLFAPGRPSPENPLQAHP